MRLLPLRSCQQICPSATCSSSINIGASSYLLNSTGEAPVLPANRAVGSAHTRNRGALIPAPDFATFGLFTPGILRLLTDSCAASINT